MSLTEFLENSPVVRQNSDFDCGPAVVNWMYRAHGQVPSVDPYTLVNADGLVAGVETMRDLLLPLGPTICDRTLSHFPSVCLLWEDDSPCEHWVVALWRTDRSMLLMDPEEEEFRTMSLLSFSGALEDTSSPLTVLYPGLPPGFPKYEK